MRRIETTLLLAAAFALSCDDKAGGGDDSGGDSGGGDLAVAAECLAYFDCVAEVAPDQVDATQDAYGEGSECWATEENAAACATACDQAMDALAAAYPDAEACGGKGSQLSATVDWGKAEVSIAISDGGGRTWWWGLAETGGCSDCWTGEDCEYGYTSSTGTQFGPYCHDVGQKGDSLAYNGDAGDLAAGTTAFPSAAFDGSVTYLLRDAGGKECFVWGEDPTYYDGLGCSVVDW